MSKVSMQVKGFMTAQPYTVRVDEALEQVHDVLRKNGVHHLPVLRSGKLVGVISETDLRMALSLKGADAHRMTAEDVCSADVYTAHPETPLRQVAKEMAERHYGCVVITDSASRQVVGIVTSVDLARALCQALGAETV